MTPGDAEALRALYGRVDPHPAAPPPPGHRRACLCVEVGDADAVAALERGMLAEGDRLTCVRSTGCGCCVVGWDIEGPAALIDSLPAAAVAEFDWPSPTASRPWSPVGWGRRLWRRWVRRG
jgi:hypothetical protein